MRGNMRTTVLVALVLGLVGLARAAGPANKCVGCHETEVLPISLGHSFQDWRASAHGRGGVGCEKCHGGDARVATADAAHHGVLPATDPASLVHPTHLPDTCGACHTQELAAFKGTVHAKQLAEKSTGATCFTCHGAMATSLPTPRELAARCGVCHDKPLQAELALGVLVMAKMQIRRTERELAAATTASPAWRTGARERLHQLERDYHAIQLRWHTFAMAEVLQDSRDVLKLASGLRDEIGVMSRRGAR